MEGEDTTTALLACDFKDCDYRCSDAEDLKTHKLTHTKKPFACEECDYRSSRADHLERHMLTHTGEKPFVCDVKDCKFSCSQVGTLSRHMLTHSGEKPFACDVKDCKYSYSRADHLERHMLTHTGDKPFACDVKDCKFSCSRAETLKTHLLTHTGEKPFECDVEGCDYCCSTNSNLKTHKGVWHVRCQSEACAVYDQADRRPGTYLVESKRYCYYCVLCLFSNMVKRKVRKEHFILAEIQRRVPELEKDAYHWKWDCCVEGGCSMKEPDMIFMFKDFYIQIEVDEDGHRRKSCVDEDTRLEIIAADAKKPGLVLRINPDSEPPAFKRFKLENGEAAWTATSTFNTLMDTVGGFLRKTMERDSKSFQGLERCMIWTSSSEVATGSNGGWRAA